MAGKSLKYCIGSASMLEVLRVGRFEGSIDFPDLLIFEYRITVLPTSRAMKVNLIKCSVSGFTARCGYRETSSSVSRYISTCYSCRVLGFVRIV